MFCTRKSANVACNSVSLFCASASAFMSGTGAPPGRRPPGPGVGVVVVSFPVFPAAAFSPSEIVVFHFSFIPIISFQ